MRESQCLDTDLNWQRDLKGKNEKIWIKTSVLAATASAGGGRVGWVAQLREAEQFLLVEPIVYRESTGICVVMLYFIRLFA